MKIEKNEGFFDRFIRFLVAEILFITTFFWLSGWVAVIVYVIAVISLVTALTGFCGLYQLLKIRTIGKVVKNRKMKIVVAVIVFVVIGVVGGYLSDFFTKKLFLEDYNRMNNYYKQTLFFTGQNNRLESSQNYERLVGEYAIFSGKYFRYHPYVIMSDEKINSDLLEVSNIISSLKDVIASGDLTEAHKKMENIRPIFQDILKRNGFSMLAVALVDFHDAMEKVIAAADAKDSAALLAVYPEVSEKLKAVEELANDSEIQLIRKNLDDIRSLASEGKSDQLSAKAAELKSSFVKVYLTRG